MKLYSLKYALYALEKGFRVEFNYDGIGICASCKDHLLELIFKLDTHRKSAYGFLNENCFKIFPKKEKIKLYHALYHTSCEEIEGLVLKISQDMYANSDEFCNKIGYRCILVGLITEFPKIVGEKEVEIHYDECMFGKELNDKVY